MGVHKDPGRAGSLLLGIEDRDRGDFSAAPASHSWWGNDGFPSPTGLFFLGSLPVRAYILGERNKY